MSNASHTNNEKEVPIPRGEPTDAEARWEFYTRSLPIVVAIYAVIFGALYLFPHN